MGSDRYAELAIVRIYDKSNILAKSQSAMLVAFQLLLWYLVL
jgi:hypothetical protein